jgi:hypothetical protein
VSETISTPERRDVTLVCGPTGLTPVKGKEGPGGPTGRPPVKSATGISASRSIMLAGASHPRRPSPHLTA